MHGLTDRWKGTFPDFIYYLDSKTVMVTKSNEYLMSGAEYGDFGPQKFNDTTEVKKFLKENNMNGTVGYSWKNNQGDI